MSNNNSNTGVGIGGVLGIVFITLKTMRGNKLVLVVGASTHMDPMVYCDRNNSNICNW